VPEGAHVFPLPYAPPARRPGTSNTLGEIRVAERRVALKLCQDAAIERIQSDRFFHDLAKAMQDFSF
jgi:hypothetical protein